MRYPIIVAGILVLAMPLAGCVTTPTPYQPYRSEGAGGVHGGFSEEQLAPNRYRVRFHGNELTSREQVEKYLLYRSAELTVAQGYDWFLVAQRHTEHDVETTVRQPIPRYWSPNWRYYRSGRGWDVWYPGGSDPFWADSIDITTVEAFEAEAEIVLGRNPAPSSEPQPIDARRVIAELGPTIVHPRQR